MEKGKGATEHINPNPIQNCTHHKTDTNTRFKCLTKTGKEKLRTNIN